MSTKVGDTRLLQLHYTIQFSSNKVTMFGRMPYILFHMPYSKNYHIRLDPDMEWMMNHLNAFDDDVANKWDSATSKGNAPFDVSEVTFECWHFTCNNPQSQCQFDSSHRATGGDGSSDFMAKALQAARDYVITPTVLTTQHDPFARGDSFVPLQGGNHEVRFSASPPVNSQYWASRQQLLEGKDMLD